MADAAAHLVDRVLPSAPYRLWVFTVPEALRLRLARGPAWATWVGNLAVRAIGALDDEPHEREHERGFHGGHLPLARVARGSSAADEVRPDASTSPQPDACTCYYACDTWTLYPTQRACIESCTDPCERVCF